MEKKEKMQVFSSFFWKFGERILAIGTSFIITLFLSRILSPMEYGEVALALVIINIADILVSAGLGNSLIQKKAADNVDFSSALYLNIFISLVIYVLIFILAPFFSSFFDYNDLTLVIRVLCIKIPIAAINSIQQAYVSKTMQFKKFFWATFWGTIISGIVGICLALNNWGAWALVSQSMLNTIIDTIVLHICIEWRPIKIFDRKRVVELYRYGWKLMVSGVLDAVYNQIRNLIIGKNYSAKSLAFYTNGTQYPQAATSAINTSISSVLFPTLSKRQDSRDNVKSITRKAISISSYILWPIMFGMIVVAPSFVRVFLTDKWLPCVPYLRIACLAYGFWPIHTSNLEALKAMGRSDIFLKLELVKSVIAFSILIVSMKFGVMAIAVSLLITSIVSGIINAYPNRKILNYGYLEQIKDMIPSIFKSIIMAMIGFIPVMFVKNSIALMLCQIVICITVYFIISKITKDKNMIYLINLVHKKILHSTK